MPEQDVVTGQESVPIAAETPVQQPEVTTAPVDTAGADTPKSEAPDADKETKKVLRGVQKRIDELTRERHEAERKGKAEAEHWRNMAMQQAQALEQARAAVPGPRWEDYQDLEKYTAAVANFQADKIVRERIAETEKTRYEETQRNIAIAEQQRQQAQFNAVVQQKIEEATRKYPDFMDVVTGPELPGLQGTAAFNAILDSEQGAEVMYYLGKHPQKAHQIVALSPISQIREIGRIEAAIASGRTVTQAPPPPESVGSKGSGGTKDPARMSYDEFVKYRRNQIAQRR